MLIVTRGIRPSYFGASRQLRGQNFSYLKEEFGSHVYVKIFVHHQPFFFH